MFKEVYSFISSSPCPICNYLIATTSTNLKNYATLICDTCYKFSSSIYTVLTFSDEDDMQVYFNMLDMTFFIKFLTNEAYVWTQHKTSIWASNSEEKLLFYKQFDNNQETLNYILDFKNQISKCKKLFTLL